MLRHWDNVVQGGNGGSEQGEWPLRWAERGEQNQGKGIDTRIAESLRPSRLIWNDGIEPGGRTGM